MVPYSNVAANVLLSGRSRRRSVSGSWALWRDWSGRSGRFQSLQWDRACKTAIPICEGSAAPVSSAEEQTSQSPVPINRLLVANRGEIACRVIATARRLGIPTTAVFSEADRSAVHARSADEAFCIGPPAARDSYLRMDRILEVSASLEHAVTAAQAAAQLLRRAWA